MSDLRTPLARVKGLGAAKDGTHHFWMQRITAVALVPLTIWFCLSLAGISGSSYADLVKWLSSPWTVTMVVSFLVVGFYHGALGAQVILEDYIGDKAMRTAAIIVVHILSFFLTALAVISVIKISLGGA